MTTDHVIDKHSSAIWRTLKQRATTYQRSLACVVTCKAEIPDRTGEKRVASGEVNGVN